MPSPKANPPQKPRRSNEGQHTIPGPPHDKDDGPNAGEGNDADSDDAESIDSSATRMPSNKEFLRDAEEFRQRKIRLGGKPTRPIEEFSRERILGRYIWYRSPTDEEFEHHYAGDEAGYFRDELTAWEAFVRSIRST